jgi:hypothetical protein
VAFVLEEIISYFMHKKNSHNRFRHRPALLFNTVRKIFCVAEGVELFAVSAGSILPDTMFVIS